MTATAYGLTSKDQTIKIFFNTSGAIGDLSEETKAFLKYIGGTASDDDFVRKLEDRVNTARKNDEWRREYMTLYMRDLENRELGRQEEKIQIVKTLLRKGLLSDAEIISVTDISPEELQEIRESVNA